MRHLATFLDRTEGMIAISYLKANGIHAVALEGSTLATNPALTFSLGGFRIAVNDSDVSSAKELLHKLPKEELETCPNCGSTEISRNISWLGSFINLIHGVPFAFKGHKLRCGKCEEPL